MTSWYGIEWRGAWSDPILHYKGHRFNGTDIQDALWESYLDNAGDWVAWVIANAVDYLDETIWLTESE